MYNLSPTNETQIIPIAESNDNKTINVSDGEILSVLTLKNTVMFPGVLMPVTVARPQSINIVRQAYASEELIAVCCQKDAAVQEPQNHDIYALGCASKVIRTFELPDGSLTIILEGIERIQIDEIVDTQPYLKAKVSVVPEILPERSDKTFIATVSSIKDVALNILNGSKLPPEASFALKNIDNPPTLVNYICVNFGFKVSDKQMLLEQLDMTHRAEKVLEMLNKEQDMLFIKQSIQEKTREEMSKEQREYYLQHQMRQIQKELGDTTAQTANEMREKAKEKKWSEDIAKTFENEVQKLERMSSHSPEYSIQLNYLNTLLDLPWAEYTEDNLDIHHAAEVLNKDHFGMEKVKERILEYLSVLKMKQLQQADSDHTTFKAPIICLWGPPGVGKTSLGKSIATALGRKYTRISLGGLHDEAEVRGHRRTYIGALPGRIMLNIQKARSANPVFVLDEIDKISADYHGDPTSALLEVLDPEQNTAFHDNYLDVDFDLSKVLFICTANDISAIPRPLRDRMEMIEMTGYLEEEKIEIAKRHLLPKEFDNHGLTAEQLVLTDDILSKLIERYTRESGVRNLDRQIASLMRKIVKKVATNEPYNAQLTEDDLQALLGKPRFSHDMYENNQYVGVVTGLAWTQVGGEILFIESSLAESKGPSLTLTGNLGDVMKESAQIALGYIRAHYKDLGIDLKKIQNSAVHIHVPEGAIPKDGPSAGITMTTALVSAFTGKKVRDKIAMTGEMTLRGKVLPVGGIREKILAAKRAGINHIILCHENEKDIEEIPAQYVQGLTFNYVHDISEVLRDALISQ